MANQTPSIAFFANWKNKPSEYFAGPQEEEETSNKIEQAFANARSRGIRMYGRYGCRWSAHNQYFTFWLCPDFEALEQTMDELEAAGDFKFADSEHIIGVQVADDEMTDDDFLTKDGPDETRPLGFFALWRLTDTYHRSSAEIRGASNRKGRQAFNYAIGRGVRMLGRYGCGWSTRWQYFTFWQVPSLEVLDDVMLRLEQAGDFWFAESHHIIGNLEPYFRFATHLRISQERADGGY